MKKIVWGFALIMCASCGNNTPKPAEQDAENTEVTTSGDENTITLNSDDRMMFDRKEIRVKAGKKVTLTLKHIGKMPKNAMGHNFVLLKKGTDISSFGIKAMTASDNQYIPKESDEVIAHTDLIGGGESSTITFDAPEIGEYDFICSFPGHYAMMKGKFIVE